MRFQPCVSVLRLVPFVRLAALANDPLVVALADGLFAAAFPGGLLAGALAGRLAMAPYNPDALRLWRILSPSRAGSSLGKNVSQSSGFGLSNDPSSSRRISCCFSPAFVARTRNGLLDPDPICVEVLLGGLVAMDTSALRVRECLGNAF
jgi:hypothetical protein